MVLFSASRRGANSADASANPTALARVALAQSRDRLVHFILAPRPLRLCVGAFSGQSRVRRINLRRFAHGESLDRGRILFAVFLDLRSFVIGRPAKEGLLKCPITRN